MRPRGLLLSVYRLCVGIQTISKTSVFMIVRFEMIFSNLSKHRATDRNHLMLEIYRF